jgi:hypothetical protein
LIVHRFAFPATLLAVALIFATVAGCGARDGGACQLDGDCATGLFCCKNVRTPDARGVCRMSGTTICATAVLDASTDDADVDAFRADAEVDAFTPDDAFTADAEIDASEEDAAADDAGTDAGRDAGDVDAGSDAGP